MSCPERHIRLSAARSLEMRFLWPMGARKSLVGKMGLDLGCGKGGVGWTGGREGQCRQERLPGLRTI